MSNIKTLISVNHNAYAALKNKNDIQVKIGNYHLVEYKHDSKSEHGGIAYYNPDDKSVIIAHRGSATLTDWLKHNPRIALEVIGRPIETMADVSGKRFTNQILEKLDQQGNEIGLVIHGGHSLGGRISQHSLIEVSQNLKLETKSLTFNSAPIKNPTDNNYKDDHINLKLSGGSIYNTDLVSSFGTQLGENYKVTSNKIGNPISAHSLHSFKHIENENENFVSDNLIKIFNHVKHGKTYAEYPNNQLSVDNHFEEEKRKTIYSLGGIGEVPTGVQALKNKIEPDLFSFEYGDNSVNKRLAEKFNHFDDDFTGQNKDKKFFIDQHSAVVFAEENFKEIKELLEQHSKYSGYENLEEYMEKSPYFSDFKKENIEKTLDNQANEQQKEILASLANYSLDSTVYDQQYFADMQKGIEQDYSKSEVYIFLSDSDSQCVVYRSDMFTGDQTSELQTEVEAKVVDKVEQVEDFLEANEALLQQKVNRLNVIDSRANPQALALKGMLQNRLNHVREDIAELKPFHSVTATPLGTDKNNVILVDTKNDNLYSVSKNKIVGHDIDLDDILKNHKNIELFNNGNKVEAKSSDNTLHNARDNVSVKQRSSEKGLDLDM